MQLRKKYKNGLLLGIASLVSLTCFQQCTLGTAPFYSLNDLTTVIPLKVGATWTYRQINYQDVGPPFEDTITVVKKIARSIDTLSSRYYAVEETSYYKNSTFIGIYSETITTDQYTQWRGPKGEIPYFPEIVLELPLTTGNQWFFNGKDTTYGYVRIMNADTTIQTPSRVFEHTLFVKVIHVRVFPIEEFFIAPGIGIVKELISSGFGGYSRELTSANF